MDFLILRLTLSSAVVIAHFHVLTGTAVPWFGFMSSTIAVQAFFVVSGWIVTASYMSSSSATGFYIRRAARLYPLYALVVVMQAVGVLLVTEGGGDVVAELIRYLGANLTFANFAKPTLLGFLGQSSTATINPSLWTLKIEVLFYLTLPLYVALTRRFGWLALLGMYAASIVFATAIEPYSHELAKQLPGQLRFFVAGMVCQRLIANVGWAGISRAVVFVAGALGYVLAHCFEGSLYASALQPVFVAAFVAASTRLIPSAGNFPDISYGVYLIHSPLIQFSKDQGWLAYSGGGLAAIFLCTVALSLLAHHFVEQPAIRWGRLWSDRQSGAGHGGALLDSAKPS